MKTAIAEIQENGLPLVAIIGRPNVGKSALFNLLAGRRVSIVHEESGVTRDSVAVPVDWYGRKFMLTDTGGLALRQREKKADIFDAHIRRQVEAVAARAACLIWVVDGQAGHTAQDAEVADLLHALGKPVVLAVNKADNEDLRQSVAGDFARFGFAEMFAVSCLHRFGVSALVDACLQHVPATAAEANTPPRPVHLAVVGRPNVGKSSLVNRLLGTDRVLVSEIPGTTRDAVDLPVRLGPPGDERDFVLIDTAGLRRRRELDSAVEIFSVMRAENAISRADIVLLVLDASAPATAQDRRIARLIADAGKPCIILANKWDLAGGEMNRKLLVQEIQEKMAFMSYAPVVCTCAISGYNLKEAAARLLKLHGRLQEKLPTPVVNQFLRDLFMRTPPPAVQGKQLKFFYATMVGQAPPKFVLFVNNAKVCAAAYKQFIRNRLADNFFPDSGLPVVLELRSRRGADAGDAAHAGRRQAAAGVMRRKQAEECAVEKRQQRGRR